MLIAEKKIGQQILAKLRKDGEVWVTIPDISSRAKFILEDGKSLREYKRDWFPGQGDLALVVINQRLHAMYVTDHEYVSDELRIFYPKKIYGYAKYSRIFEKKT